MPEPEIDEVTLRRAARGDASAARRFVLRYQDLVFATASRVLGRGAPDVADVSQESFLRAFRALDSFDPRGPARPSTWLATIVTRAALDAVRRRRAALPLEEAREVHDEVARNPEQALEHAQRSEQLARALEALDADQRATLVLRVEHGLSYEDVARALGVEVGTVKSRLSRARAALAAAVGDHPRTREHHGRA